MCQKLSQKKYDENNPGRVKQSKKRWRKNNPEKCLVSAKVWRKANIEKVKIIKEIWRKNNPEGDNRRNLARSRLPVFYDTYASQLSFAETVSKGPNSELVVLCAYCGKKHTPNLREVRHRVTALTTLDARECRFYCSEHCKKSCPIFNQKKYPRGFKKATSREVVPLLRQLVLERDDYTCQKCEVTTETAQLHVHHEKSYTLNKIMANDPDNCITLCKECHKFIHSQEGCRYVDLQC
jgi:hypothetical protein